MITPIYTLRQIMNNKMFRKMSVDELSDVLNHEISYEDFMAIKPDGKHDFAREKAKALLKKWGKEKKTTKKG